MSSPKPAPEEKTADGSTTPQSESSPRTIVPPNPSTPPRHVHHFSRASLDEAAALEEARDTVEADSIQLRQKFDTRYTPGQIGRVDSERAGTLDRLLSQRMARGVFEGRFLRNEEHLESLLNRSSRLNVLLAQRPSKEKLEQMNVIKTASVLAHSNLTAAQTSLASAQRRARLQGLIARRPPSLDLTKRNILILPDAEVSSSSVRSTQSVLQPLIQARPSPSQLLEAKVLIEIPSPGGARHEDVWEAREVAALKGEEAVRVVCGFAHTLVLTRRGAVLGFGNQTGGRLGRGDSIEEEDDEDEDEDDLGKTPKPVTGLDSVTALASGDNHSFAVVKGQLYGWGSGQWGRLGTGSQSDQYVAVHVPVGKELVRAVTCGAYHTVVLTCSKAVYAFGWNKQGRVGVGRQQSSLQVLTPALISSLSPSALSSPIAGICAGQQHTLAWTEAGGVFSWGGGSYGCLGHGDEEDQWEPRGISALQGVKVTQCAAGAGFSLASSAEHVLYSWGSNKSGELGRKGDGLQVGKVDLPFTPSSSGPITSMVCGKAHTLIIQKGVVYSWGHPSRGVLGRGEGCDSRTPAPVLGINTAVVDAGASWSHSAVVTKDGKVLAFGSSTDGKLGL